MDKNDKKIIFIMHFLLNGKKKKKEIKGTTCGKYLFAQKPKFPVYIS
jgi:hypothetical protein